MDIVEFEGIIETARFRKLSKEAEARGYKDGEGKEDRKHETTSEG